VLAARVVLGDGVVARRLLAGPGGHVPSGTVLGHDVVLGDGVDLAPDGPIPDGARVPEDVAGR
jgi:hypothetical protein